MKNRDTTASAVGGTAAILGGVTWLLLVPAAELHRRDLLGYDGYNRLLAIPLLLFLVALLAAPSALTVTGRSVRAGLIAAAVGMGLLLAGNVAEFYGVLLQDQPNAYAATQAGETDHWVGSDIGWIAYAIGMLVLIVGGLTAAAAMLLHRMRPTWVIAFTATLGVGVLAANLFALQALLLSVSVLAIYAAGWIAFGFLTRRGGVSRTAQRSAAGRTEGNPSPRPTE
jgi:glucan phosphoethanolaminetransferase (alkaline phosphatase superfamily)